jgi:predicted transcriptional regulator
VQPNHRRKPGRPPIGEGRAIPRTISLDRETDAELDRRAAGLGIYRSLYIRQALYREFRREDRERRRNDRRGLTTDDW